MVFFDIEWNHGCDHIPLDEILQIGAVRTDPQTGKIADTFNVYIRPLVHGELGVKAREVLDIQMFSNAEFTFPKAFDAFLQWCGEDRALATWGNSDIEVLRRNCAYWKIPFPELEAVYDIQASFSAVLGTQQRVALYRAAEYCGIPDCFDCHDALCDAVYTAVIREWIPADRLLPGALPKRLERLSREEFVQRRKRVGPFMSDEAALNSGDSRSVECPLCGRRLWINAWHHQVPRKYFADVCCPEHGWFICRMTLTPQTDGSLRGRVTVPVITQSIMWEFHEATKGQHDMCVAVGKKRRRRKTVKINLSSIQE